MFANVLGCFYVVVNKDLNQGLNYFSSKYFHYLINYFLKSLFFKKKVIIKIIKNPDIGK